MDKPKKILIIFKGTVITKPMNGGTCVLCFYTTVGMF